MKSYTDLPQSKVLSKFLPLESADMYYFDDNGGDPNFKARNGITYYYDSEDCLSCWSLAALLNVLPDNEHIEIIISRGGWKIDPVEYLPNTWWCEYEDTENQTEFHVSADNPVDACYEMILKLHELNLL